MQTSFTLAQLADPNVANSEKILRTCVHCGLCTATCPTYVLLGDELDSPRGRIYLIKNMLEGGGPATERVVKHVDRCLSCLSCMTTCPSGVNYMHLVDHARQHIEATYRRPFHDRMLRAMLALILPRPALFRLALVAGWLARPVMRRLPGRLGGLGRLVPRTLAPPSPVDRPQVFAAEPPRRKRVALLAGCAQQVLRPEINEATIRLLTRHGVEVVIASGSGCCGAIAHHLGRGEAALGAVRDNVAAWDLAIAEGGLDAIVINASGCGTMVKDYGFLLRDDPRWAAPAARVAGLARDVSEFLAELGLKTVERRSGIAVAYQSACSLQHGQKVTAAPQALLALAGFDVREIPESHLCCGSAGTYNILQPEIAAALRARKIAAIASVEAGIVATGNIGCMQQIADPGGPPVLHTAELLDWATGGPAPERARGRLAQN